MEGILEKIQNSLSNRQIDTYEVVGTCNDNGELVLQLPFQAEYKEDATYYVSLLELSTTSFFPNVDPSNNKFYYSTPSDNTIKTITIPTGAYDVDQYGEYIASCIPKVKENNVEINPVDITVSSATGLVIIKLFNGYKIHFDKNNTWRNELGYDANVLQDKVNTSTRIANILKVHKVYLSCDICKGSYYNGKQTNILFSFGNSKRYGYPLSIIQQKRQYKLLNKKSFNRIVFRFFDDNDKPVDFLGATVTLCIEIKQI